MSKIELDFEDKNNDVTTTDDLILELKRRGAVQQVIKELSDNDLLEEVGIRDLNKIVVEGATEEELSWAMRVKGVKPLFDARPVELIHELRRLDCTATVENYYYEGKKRARPHASDKVGVDIIEKCEDVLREARNDKKGKWWRIILEPVALYTRATTDDE